MVLPRLTYIDQHVKCKVYYLIFIDIDTDNLYFRHR